MQKRTLIMQLFSGESLLDFDVFERLWRLLETPPAACERFGLWKPLDHRCSEGARRGFEIFNEDRHLLLSGNKARLGGSIWHLLPENLGSWRFRLTLDVWEPTWLDWMLDSVKQLSILFGYACADDEWEEKHGVHERIPGHLGQRHGQVGAADSDFQRWLPGLYWCTIFGPELTRALDVSRALSLPNISNRSLARGHSALLFGETPFVDDEALEQRLELEIAAADQINGDYFFDRDRPIDRLRPVESLQERLRQLRDAAPKDS